MNNVYDNSELMIGSVKDVIEVVKKEIADNIDMLGTEILDILKDLIEIKDDDENTIVCINYDSPMGYTINTWCSSDIVYRG